MKNSHQVCCFLFVVLDKHDQVDVGVGSFEVAQQ